MSHTFTQADQQLFRKLLAARRDVRGNKFSQEPVSDQELEQILEAGLTAPSVGFSQPWQFVVVRDPARRARIKEIFTRENTRGAQAFRGARLSTYQQLKLEGIEEAPVSVAVFYRPSQDPVLGQTSMTEMGLYSVVCAVQNIWLMARAMNIGVGWVSIIDPDQVKQELDVPEDWQLVAWLCVGRVTEFLDTPELESLGWDQRRKLRQVMHQEKVSGAQKVSDPSL